jgi:hypothetical protein
MQLTFLQAAIALTKGYERKPDGSYAGGSYPGVTNFTSHVEQISGPKTFADALLKHAAKGHCLLTNSLSRPIVGESRRKLSDKEELREWIVLDVDGIAGITDANDFVKKCLPEQFHNTSYILQHSPSSGIKPGVRVHLFFLMDHLMDVRSVAAWLKATNLDTQLLSDQITLSKNAMALSYTLDWVANNNGRIIYITSPECKGFSDPVTERIVLVEKKYEKLYFNFSGPSLIQTRMRVQAKLVELRQAAGLPVSRIKDYYEDHGKFEAVKDELVEPARITSAEADNDRFMRCNLDGGDSFAYYYHRDNPKYLHNFKGEPSVKLSKLDIEYYNRVAKPDMEKLLEKENRPFAFVDDATDKVYVGVRRGTEIIRQPQLRASTLRVEDYFLEFGNTSPPSPIPTWDRVFDPTSNIQWDEPSKQFNSWRPTIYQTNAIYRSQCPEVINKVLRHVTGNDEGAYLHFMNWLAYIYQKRTKSGTAWVLHGIPGTGKGVLYNYIIRPIFGPDYCTVKQIRELKDGFNGWMEQAMFVNVDETNSQDAGKESKEIINALKQWITDPFMSVRHMHATAVMRHSFINFIFTTNDFGMLPIQDGDRRFNVAPRQHNRISLSLGGLATIKNELQDFAGYLSGYQVDEVQAHTSFENEAKELLKLAAETSIDAFFRACREGDLRYFIEGYSSERHAAQRDLASSYQEFAAAITQWTDDAKRGKPSQVSGLQLKHAHIILCRDKGMKAGAFERMCAHRGFDQKRKRENNDRWIGWSITWKLDDDTKRDLKMHLQPVKTASQMETEIQNEINSEKAE